MNNLNINYYDYSLPEELIAQSPLETRSDSRLLVLSRESAEVSHDKFANICDYLKSGDCLVLNDTRVMQARMFGELCRDSGNAVYNTEVEFLLIRRSSDELTWEVIVRPGKRARKGDKIVFGDGFLFAEILDVLPDGNRLVRFSSPLYSNNSADKDDFMQGLSDFIKTLNISEESVKSLSGDLSRDFQKILGFLGNTPLPPYIKKYLDNPDRYQTVYAENTGSAAAPTAGLHFTNEILDKIKSKGVKIVFITLHVGLGTFRSVKVDNISLHNMHKEYFDISCQAAECINNTKKSGGRVICVGTTSVRTLETMCDDHGFIKSGSGFTDIFIYPPYKFKTVDCLITNFHLPKSTLIMLVCAFAGRDSVMEAYKQAVLHEYRFFSFGDCMLIC